MAISSMLPDPRDIIGGAKDSIASAIDPLELFRNDEPARQRDLIEIVDEMEQEIKDGNFESARDLIDDGRGSTSCSWCRDKLDRVEVDVDYVKNICRIDGGEECSHAKDVVAKKIDYIGETLRKAVAAVDE